MVVRLLVTGREIQSYLVQLYSQFRNDKREIKVREKKNREKE